MNFWVLSPNVYNNNTEADWKKAIVEFECAFIGYFTDHPLGRLFHDEIKVGDFILIAQGQNSAKKFFFCGVVSSNSIWENKIGTPGIAQNRKLKYILNKGILDGLNLDFIDSTWGASKQPAALYKLKPDHVPKDKIIAEKLSKAIQESKDIETMQQKIDILKYKNQIILQGPPGTGKTRLAKMIAHEFTKSEVKLTPADYIEWYIKNFKSSKKIRENNLYLSNLLKEFTEEFSLEIIKQISLEQYCLGKGSNTSFCYWIERGLKDLGRFSPGPAGTTVYGVYYSQEDNDYVSTTKTPDELLKDIQVALAELIEKEDYTEARKLFRQSFILKILNSYYPEKYFPILSQTHLNAIAKIFGIDTGGFNDIEINKKVNEEFNKLKTKHSSEISNYNLMSHLYDKFKIKENQFDEVLIDVIDELGETKLIQFHPAYSYEDFVRGIVVETNQNSQVEYKVVNKIVSDFAHKALGNPSTNYVLIIDEINRANLPSVLGELIYALEYRYDEDKQNEKEATVESMYALKQNEKDVEGDNTLMLPTNFYIIGTMNTADRSVGHIDYAIRRRFAFVDVLPEIEPVHPGIKDDFIKISKLFVKNFEGVVEPSSIENADTMASDFRAEDVWLGHSYFICKNDDGSNKDKIVAEPILKMKMKYEVIPILKEYIKDGILINNDEVKKVMNELVSEYGM